MVDINRFSGFRRLNLNENIASDPIRLHRYGADCFLLTDPDDVLILIHTVAFSQSTIMNCFEKICFPGSVFPEEQINSVLRFQGQ